MKKKTEKPEKAKAEKTGGKKSSLRSRQALQGGGYSLIVSVVVLAILIAVNIFVSALPSSMTTFDISASKLYSITSNTKVVVNSLEEDVTIYWIVQADEEDDIITNLLDKYESLSDHIHVEKRNPDVYPGFMQKYLDDPEETVANNSLVVECGDRFRYIPYTDIYVQEPDVYSYSYNTSFDGEGAVTSAIDYVVNAVLPKVYILEGHGEADLPATIADQIEKENIETEQLSLATEDEIPEDAAAVMLYAPQSDISDVERDLLADYTAGGGKLLAVAGPVQDGSLDNLYSLLQDYGVEPVEGIVIEGDQEHYSFEGPFELIPELVSGDITDSLIDSNYRVWMPLAIGLNVEGADEGVTSLMNTTESSYSKKAGLEMTTYDKEEGDIDGPFSLGVSIDCGNGGSIIWFTSSHFLQDMINAYSSGANGDLTMNALASLVGETEAMAIRSKSLNYNYLTISESASTVLKLLLVGVFPLAYLGIGVVVVMRRRKKQREPV